MGKRSKSFHTTETGYICKEAIVKIVFVFLVNSEKGMNLFLKSKLFPFTADPIFKGVWFIGKQKRRYQTYLPLKK